MQSIGSSSLLLDLFLWLLPSPHRYSRSLLSFSKSKPFSPYKFSTLLSHSSLYIYLYPCVELMTISAFLFNKYNLSIKGSV